MNTNSVPFEDNPFEAEVLLCNTCNRIVRVIPAVSPGVLYSRRYSLYALCQSILSYNDYFICYLCCQTLKKNWLRCKGVSKVYYCFICKNKHTLAICSLKNVSKTLSRLFDIPVYNTKYICYECTVVVASANCMYKLLSKNMHYCLKKFIGCQYIASYICQPIILPSIVARPSRTVFSYDIVRNIDLAGIEYRMRNTNICIEGREILSSRKDISNSIMELDSQQKVLKYIAETTRYVSSNLRKRSEDYEILDTDSEYNCVTDVVAITETVEAVHLEDAYINPNAEEIPVDWLLFDMETEKDEKYVAEYEAEEVDEFYEGPSCSYRTRCKYKK
ncbi:hypothetical protein RN001_015751 [Aquatica leii]|uniref:Uncharacterized protein n=1 Tax=Aquatica leii TaxID=1421715 RepID=A0AAN7PNE6_9COLE|nr:hypothetical protein RN001_015751 [Aquatica leii]